MAGKKTKKAAYVSMPTVLVCAPSGTGLSSIGRRLENDCTPLAEGDAEAPSEGDRKPPTKVFDLETALCDSFKNHPRLSSPTGASPGMAQVLYLPRREVLEKWDKTCETILATPVRSASQRAIFLHLTWYHADTSELFSPITPAFFVRKDDDTPDRDVRHVILLIDDIYDMFLRLKKEGDLYSNDNIETDAELLEGLRKFRAMHQDTGLTDEEQEEIYKARRRLEAVELALMQLIAWRRNEIVQAENLARTLGAEFTLLGTKHSWNSFRYLVERPAIRKTYLSHRISEVRRRNKQVNALPGDLGEWREVVHEVNDLHLEFLDHEQLLINPTAIDELRFDDLEPWRPMSADQESADQQNPAHDPIPLLSRGQSPLLARRWPLPRNTPLSWSRLGGEDAPLEDALTDDLSPDDASVQHTELLKGGLELHDPISSAIARTLSTQIYFDISARDHMIVEHTPGLCVYRPFFSTSHSGDGEGTDWSRGVKREIDHWRKKDPGAVESRAAFVHTRSEIMARLQWLKSDNRFENEVTGPTGRLLRDKLLDWEFDSDETKALFEGRLGRGPSHLERRPEATIRYRAGEILNWIETYALISLRHMFTRLDSPESRKGDSGVNREVELFVAEEGRGQSVVGLGTLAKSLCSFFGNGDSCGQCGKPQPPVVPGRQPARWGQLGLLECP